MPWRSLQSRSSSPSDSRSGLGCGMDSIVARSVGHRDPVPRHTAEPPAGISSRLCPPSVDHRFLLHRHDDLPDDRGDGRQGIARFLERVLADLRCDDLPRLGAACGTLSDAVVTARRRSSPRSRAPRASRCRRPRRWRPHDLRTGRARSAWPVDHVTVHVHHRIDAVRVARSGWRRRRRRLRSRSHRQRRDFRA